MPKLCPRGKAAAKRKFAVYPSAYANAYASKICAGKIKDPSGTKRKDFRGPKPKAKKGGMAIVVLEKVNKKKEGGYMDIPNACLLQKQPECQHRKGVLLLQEKEQPVIQVESQLTLQHSQKNQKVV